LLSLAPVCAITKLFKNLCPLNCNKAQHFSRWSFPPQFVSPTRPASLANVKGVNPAHRFPPFSISKRSTIMNNETPNQPVAAEAVPSRATGPRTEAGKAVSSQNARKHDLCSKTLRLSTEEWTGYNDMRGRYARDLQPADDIEETLVDEICFNYWRLQQAREAELGIIDKHSTALHLIALYIRYRTGYERAFYKALDQIQKRQRDRRKQPGNTPVRSEKPETQAAPVRSAEPPPLAKIDAAEAALQLEDELETHLLENKVRAELLLPPLELPAKLARRGREFVSQNPRALPEHLISLFQKAA
jgi:hypothetical protein